jgi:tRNA nucleotidyltransferase (CCA-adding enzyme)
MAPDRTSKGPDEIIISHPGTDFDSLASMWAAHLLRPSRPVVMIAGADTNVREFLALYDAEFPRLKLKEIDIGAVRHITIVDCASRSQLARVEGLLDRADVAVELWDHHREKGADFRVDERHYAPVGANTTLLVRELIRAGITPSQTSATLLMLGIHEDTGSLRFPSTTAEDLEAAAWLLKAGAALDMVDRFLGIRLSPIQKQLLTALSLNVQVIEVRGISIHVTVAKAGQFVDEIAFLARKVQETENADVLFALVELNDRVFIVGRSRMPSVDVGHILSSFGGGGHAQAASCLLTDTTHLVALQRLLDAVKEEIRPSILARDIMSSPVRTIGPDATISEAGAIIARTGVSGLVVTDPENRVIGVITRREVDRAIGHDLGHAPTRGYMVRNPVTIGEETCLGEIQNLIIERHAGFLPVVSDDRVVGVVTRSDVLRALHKAPTPADPLLGPVPMHQSVELGKELLAKLPAAAFSLLGLSSEAADALGVSCYLVGGIVRDLVLGHENVDVDLLIEGDGIAFAHRLADSLAGRVIDNPRFRTAKVLLGDGRHIDVATAREEFYLQPGALPEVEAAGIRDDLVRRDFTINTLAIQLNSRRWGLLVDHFGGVSDLKAGLIRVLHTFSFVDDPTRILRALRFSARFDFQLESQTADLLQRALVEGRLDDVSPERIRDELLLCLDEDDPWGVLRRIYERGIFGVVHPSLHTGALLQSENDPIRPALDWLTGTLPPEDRPPRHHSYLAYILSQAEPEAAHEFVARFHFDNSVLRIAEALPGLLEALAALGDSSTRASELAEKLDNLPSPFWCVLAAHTAPDSPERAALERYLTELRLIKPEIDGEDFIQEGFTPGPAFGRALAAVRRAKLDGEVVSREEEMALARKILRAD